MTETVQPGVNLVGAKIRIREFRADDLDDADAILGDDRVTRWLSFDSRSREQQAQVLHGVIERAKQTPRTEYYLALTQSTVDRLIGFVRLGLTGVQAAKLGFAIAAAHWGYGYALDAAGTIINFGFTTLGLHRISAAIGPDNAASIAIVTRLGFTKEGQLRDHVFTNGAWRDSILYSLLAHEWEQCRAAEDMVGEPVQLHPPLSFSAREKLNKVTSSQRA